MTDITCKECGARNPAQSKYCNRCGVSFVSESTHLCPSCDTPNSIDLLYCDNCGTRLVDDSTGDIAGGEEEKDSSQGGRSEPFSLPSRPPGQTGDLDVSAALPDWLKTGDFSGDLTPDNLREEDLNWLRAAQEDETWSDEDAPTLEEVSSDHAPQDDLPTWLLDEDATRSIFSSEKSTDELFMESLASDESTQSDEDNDKESQLSAPSEPLAELQTWLSDLEAQEEVEEEELESKLSEFVVPHTNEMLAADASMPSEEEDDFLRWLSEVQQEAATSEGDEQSAPDSAVASFDTSDWLDLSELEDSLSDEPDPEIPAAEQEAPDWLIDLPDDQAPSGAGSSFAESSEPTPEWLIGPAVADEDSELNEQAAYSEPDHELFTAAVDDTKKMSSAQQADAGEEKTDESPEEDDFLRWLDSLDNEQDSQATGLDEELEGDHSPPAQTSSVEGQSDPAAENDFALPEWLGDLSAEDSEVLSEIPNIDTLPEWLEDLAPPAGDEITLPYVSGTEVELGTEPYPEAFEDDAELPQQPSKPDPVGDADIIELPIWIAGVTAELDSETAFASEVTQEGSDLYTAEPTHASSAAGEDSSREYGPAELDAQPISSDDLPDWFSDVLDDIDINPEPEDIPASTGELINVPEQLASADLPDWLDSPFVDEAPADPTPLEEIPDWLRTPLKEQLARTAEERGLSQAALESGEEWRELLESPASSESPTRRKEDTVPQWLESLRISTAGHKETEAKDTDNLEQGGPIAGIAGAIGIAPVVAQTRSRERTSAVSGSKEQGQQAVLLRQLSRLQQEQASATLPVATTRPAALPAVVRVMLAVLLFVTVGLGLAAGNMPVEEAQTGVSGAPLMPGLNVASGQDTESPVLLVFDYTPAMAGALEPLAQKLLGNLAHLDRPILITSQSASGLALAHNLLESNAITDARDVGLVPGGAVGVRRLAQCMSADGNCSDLFGQNIAAETLSRLRSTSDVVVITPERDSLLAWIEQFSTTDTAIRAIVTPALEPVTLPYIASGQLLETAVSTALLANDDNLVAGDVTIALELARWFIAATLLVGAIYYLLQGLIRHRRD